MEVTVQETITESLKSNCMQKFISTSDKNCVNLSSLNASCDEKIVLENRSSLGNQLVKADLEYPTSNLSKTDCTTAETIDSSGKTSVGIVDSMEISVETTCVSSENECSHSTDLEINDSKQEKKSENVNLEDQIENLNKDTENAVEVTSQLEDNGNSSTANDIVLNATKSNDNTNVNIPEVMPEKNTNYRCESDSWSDDEDSSSASSSSSSDSDFFQMVVESSSQKNVPEIKTKGELGLDDLPPIEDLLITIPEEDMMLIGKIHAVVDKLVVVHAVKDMKPLDIDSVLFLTHDKPLGRVYDVFGPVVEPFYCIRFNSVEDINKKIIDIGADVFFAPEKNDITSYVFVDELQKEKGSDASWKHNNEPPEEFLDFSDDEQEKVAKRKRTIEKRNRRFSSSFEMTTKKPHIINGLDSQQNLNNRSENRAFSTPRSNANIPPVPRFNRFNRSYSSHYRQPLSRSVPSIFKVPVLTSLPSPYPSLPPPSSTPSDSSIFTAPRFTPFSTPYPPPSPTPSVSSITGALRYSPFSTSYPPPSPSPSVSSVTGAPGFANFSTPYPPPSPSPSVSVIAVSSSCSNPYPPCPPSPTPSVCSVMSVPVRARTRASFSTNFPKQPRAPQYRPFLPQNAPQRFAPPPSNLQPLRISSPQQSVSPVMLQQPFHQRTFLPQNVQSPALPLQRPAIPPQNVMQRPALQFQRPILPPTLPQQTHVFGQVTLMSPLQSPLPSPLPPPPPVNMPPPATPNYFSVNSQAPPYHSPDTSAYSHVPPHYPLTVEIPNLTNSSTSVNPFLMGNNLVLPISNNIIRNGQPSLY